jgi:hypothetical protein
MDSGKPLSGAVKRHLLRCASCREFAGAAEDAGRRLTRDAGVLIGSVDPSLAKRVQASLKDRVGAAALPQGAGLRPRPILRLRPVLTAAVALVVVGASVLYVVRWRPQPTSELRPMFQIEQPGVYLVAALEKARSPYDEEIRRWKDTIDGAAKTLEGCFDIGLGEGTN